MSVFNNMLKFISPKMYVDRRLNKMRAELIDSAYVGASSKKSLRNWRPPKGDFIRELDTYTIETLRDRCRDAYRNQLIAHGAIRRIATNVLGGVGLHLQAKPKCEQLGFSREFQRKLEKEIEFKFDVWCKSCDISEDISFNSMQALALISMLVSGDIFFNTIIDTSNNNKLLLQPIEADRVCNKDFGVDTKNLMKGIEFNDLGKKVAIHVLEQHPYTGVIDINPFIWTRIPIYGDESGLKRVFHLFDRSYTGRCNAVRGISILSPVLDSLKQLDKYTESELTAAVISSLFTVFIKTEVPYNFPSTREMSTQEEDRGEVSLGNGAIVDLSPGESVETANPARPNNNYDAFISSIIKQIGASLGLPYEVLMLNFVSSYTAARGAILQAWVLYKFIRHNVLEEYFCRPVYELWLDVEVLKGSIQIPDYWLYREFFNNSRWVGSSLGSIDPVKEVVAAGKRIDLGISTLQKETEEITGEDWEDLHKQRVIEVELRKKIEPSIKNDVMQDDIIEDDNVIEDVIEEE